MSNDGVQTRPSHHFKPYPKYKDSGVEWMAEIPTHWDVKPLKRLTTFSTGWTPSTGREDFYGGEHLWANISDLGPNVLYTTEKTISDAAIREARLRIVSAGCLLFSFKLSVGVVSIAGVDMYTNEAIAAFAPSQRIDTQYLYWAAPVFIPRNAQENIYGAPLLNRERIANALLLSPPIAEQRAIAAFIDRETANVDALVKKKERLIELLKEMRIGLISQAVTRGLPPDEAITAGLNPHPKLRPSGIDWFGHIPEHWPRPGKLWFLAASRKHSFVNGPFGSDLLTTEFVSKGVPVIYIRDVTSGRYRRVSEVFVTPEKANELDFCRVDPGDVLIAKVGDPPGTAAVYPDSEPSGIVTQDVIRLRVNKARVCASYVAYFLNSLAGQSLVDNISIESTRMRVSLGDYKNSPCLLPPLREQEAIADFLDQETAKIDRMITKVKSAIERLEEYRTALITTAVTGKIDVREGAA